MRFILLNMASEWEGFGLGLRFSILKDALKEQRDDLWFEIAPENWLGRGGFFRNALEELRENHHFVCHGLSLSIGSPDEINYEFLKAVKEFLNQFEIEVYSEHLSFSSLGGSYLHDLFPLPFTEDMVRFVSEKVRAVSEFLERDLVLENISYYHIPLKEMEEWEFINAVLQESGAKLLLDVNNIYVNSVNHGYDPYEFLEKLDLDRVSYLHIAGHERAERILIDTHGERVDEEVKSLLKFALERTGSKPVLLERDNNIPPYEELLKELKELEEFCHAERS